MGPIQHHLRSLWNLNKQQGEPPQKESYPPTPERTPNEETPTQAPEGEPVKRGAPPEESDSETSAGTAPSDNIEDFEEVDISNLFGPEEFA